MGKPWADIQAPAFFARAPAARLGDPSEGSRCSRSAPLFTGNASNSSRRAGRAPRARVITSGRCRRSRCPPRLEPSITCRRSGPPSVGQPGPHLVPPYGHPPTRQRLGPPCRPRGHRGKHLAVKPRMPSTAWPPRGPHPNPHTGEMGARVPCPPVGPDGLQGHTPWKQSLPLDYLRFSSYTLLPSGKRCTFQSVLFSHCEQRVSKRFSRTEASGRPSRFPPGPNQFWT